MKTCLLGLILMVALFASPVFASPIFADSDAERVREKHTGRLMQQAGVMGVGLGQGVLIVFTANRDVRIPEKIDGVVVRTQVIGQVVALHHRDGHNKGGDDTVSLCEDTTVKHRPACPGISTGHPDITAGTICCRVSDGIDTFALSNNHVYADENLANIGDVVLQPGAYDGGSIADSTIGILYQFKPIVFCVSYPSNCADNTIDVAIVKVDILDLGNVTPAGWAAKSETVVPSVNDKVKKFGRTTEETKGQVYATHTTIYVGYSTGVAKFVDQIIITPGSFSAGGDSGSLVVTDGKGRNKTNSNNPVGLLFAGSTTISVINPIDAVLAEFGVRIE